MYFYNVYYLIYKASKQASPLFNFAMKIRVKIGVNVNAWVSLFKFTNMINVQCSFYNSFAARKEQK